jgi:hypothetical protein
MKSRNDFPTDFDFEVYLRDYFAGQLLAGLLVGRTVDNLTEFHARACYAMADTMLSVRRAGQAREMMR